MLEFVTTIGPATRDLAQLQLLAQTGATIFRLNFSHGTYEWYGKLFEDLAIIKQEFPHVKVLADISGPSLRITTPEQKEIIATKGVSMLISAHDDTMCRLTLDGVVTQLPVGAELIFGEGYGRAEISANDGQTITIQFLEDFTIKHRMHVHTSVHVKTAAITNKDWADLEFLQDKAIDLVALSFIQDKEPIEKVKAFWQTKGRRMPIVSKIETQAAMDNLEQLVAASDWLMVARGDLALEADLFELPKNQQKIIDAGKAAGKPVIVATQMLYSMVNNPMPSRAEINDIALAVRQGASGVMLSDETTTGKYPMRAVYYLKKIAETALR